MKRVKEILDFKEYDVWTIPSEESVLAAIKLMAEKGIGALIVATVANASATNVSSSLFSA